MQDIDYLTASELLGLDAACGLDDHSRRMIGARVRIWVLDYGPDFVRENRSILLKNFCNLGLGVAAGEQDAHDGSTEDVLGPGDGLEI